MSSPRLLMLALLIGLFVPGAFSHPPGGASSAATPLRQSDGGDPVELAWVAVRPEDAAEPGYLRDLANYQTLINAAASTHVPGPEQDALAAAMFRAGYENGYFVSMDLPSAEDPKLLRQAVTSTLYRYGDEAGATQGLALLVEEYAAMGDTATGEVAAIGDEAVVYRSTGNAAQGPGNTGEAAPYQGVRLLFRSGEFVGNLVLQDFTTEPLLTEVGVLAEAVVERMAAARAGMAPLLSAAPIRFDPEIPGLRRLGDQYRRIDGETIPTITLSPEAFATQDDEATRLGVIDRYYYGASLGEGSVVYELQIDRFTDEAAVSAWLDEEPTVGLSFSRTPDFQGLEPAAEAETLGDASTVHAFNVEGTDHQGYLLRMRICDLGVVIAPRSEEGLVIAEFMQSASRQADRLRESVTCDPEGTTSDQATSKPTQAVEDPVIEPTQEAAPAEVTVEITSGGFDPGRVVIPVGGTVTWVTQEDTPFTVLVSDDEGQVAASPVRPGESFSHTFSEPGTYTAVNVFNVAMGGTIIVEPPSGETAEAPAEANQDAPEEPVEQAAAATKTYVSPSFGYSLSYDPSEWTVVEGPSSENGIDHIGLQSRPASVYLDGTTGISDAQACVESITAYFTGLDSVVAFEPLRDEAGAPVAGGDARDYFAVTRIDWAMDDGTFEETLNLRCIIFAGGDTALGITLRSPAAVYPTAERQLEALLEGLTFP